MIIWDTDKYLNILVFKDCDRELNRRQHGRVVKATDLKSVGFSRAGSNPAAVGFCSTEIKESPLS